MLRDEIGSRFSRNNQFQKVLYKKIDAVFNSFSKNSRALSVSTGDGAWDYLLLTKQKKITITATDIIPCSLQPSDLAYFKSTKCWSYHQVKPEVKLPFKNNSFDYVYHFDVLEHVQKPYLFLKTQYDCLKPEGKIIIGTPNLLRPGNLIQLLLGKLVFPFKFDITNQYGTHEHGHIQEFADFHLLALLKEIGFKKIQLHHVFFGLQPLNVCFANSPSTNLGKSLSHYLLVTALK